MQRPSPPATLRTLAILQTALIAGPLIYLVPVLLVVQNTSGITPAGPDFTVLNKLSVIHVIVLFTVLFLGNVLFERMFSPARLQGLEESEPERLALVMVGHLRTAVILRLSLLEGTAFVGIAVCIVGLTRGVMDAEPLYYLNLGSLVVLLLCSVMTFPSKERVLIWFEEKSR